MTSTENVRVTKAAGVVGAATLLSRIFGFIRDVVVAWSFGAGMNSDAFFVAFRIPNLLRRLFAEGSLTIAFIPVFSQYLTRCGKAEAFKLAQSAVWMVSVLLVLISVAGMTLAPYIVKVIAPGFSGASEKFSLTVLLTQTMFPYIFFIGLVALCMGILNVLGHFGAPALAPVLLNLSMIGAVFFLSPRMKIPILGLAIGVIIGGFLQLAFQLPFLIRKGFCFWKPARFYHPGLKKMGILLLPTVFGSAVYQVNILVGTLLASLLPEGSVSYLYYADRLVQFPLGIFAIATATAVLPSLSRQAAEKDFVALRDTFAHAVRLVLFITIPAMIGLIVLREPIVRLLFNRGAFGEETTRLTADALLYYGLGLWAFSAVRIVVSAFYAMQDTRTPVQTAVVSVLANMLLGVILMGPLGHGGLALSTALASMINLGLLVRVLSSRLGAMKWGSVFVAVWKTILCSAVMGVVIREVGRVIIPSAGAGSGGLGLLFGIVATIGVGLMSYGFLSLKMKIPESGQVLTLIGNAAGLKKRGS